MAKTKPDEGRNPLVYFIGLSLVITPICLAVAPVAIRYYDGDLTKSGQLGDTYGIANSLFSALAFGGIIITIWLQSNELRLQRRELRMQRRESKRQRIQMEKSANAQEKAEQALNMQADSLLLSAYLGALGSVRQSYADTETEAGRNQEGKIRRVLESVVEQLGPRISHIADRALRSNVTELDLNVLERDRRDKLADRIKGMARRFDVRWNVRMDSRGHITSDAAVELARDLRKQLEDVSPEVPKECDPPFTQSLRAVQAVIEEAERYGFGEVLRVNAKSCAADITGKLYFVADRIRCSIPPSTD